VLPPPYMVDSLASRQVDGFCVGAPWNSLAVELGVGRILHFGCDIIARAPEKVLAVRANWAANRADALSRLLRAISRAADFINTPANLDEVARLLAAPNRLGVAPELVRSTIEGRLRRAIDGPVLAVPRYIQIGRDGAARPDPAHAAWLYAQMVRWKQAPQSIALLDAAKACFRPDLYDAVFGETVEAPDLPPDRIGAFFGPPFEADNISRYASMGKAPLWCV
jgi:ABC-type nitrate/sulfonate/bicarbonate transport system substrate-binding protein